MSLGGLPFYKMDINLLNRVVKRNSYSAFLSQADSKQPIDGKFLEDATQMLLVVYEMPLKGRRR